MDNPAEVARLTAELIRAGLAEAVMWELWEMPELHRDAMRPLLEGLLAEVELHLAEWERLRKWRLQWRVGCAVQMMEQSVAATRAPEEAQHWLKHHAAAIARHAATALATLGTLPAADALRVAMEGREC